MNRRWKFLRATGNGLGRLVLSGRNDARDGQTNQPTEMAGRWRCPIADWTFGWRLGQRARPSARSFCAGGAERPLGGKNLDCPQTLLLPLVADGAAAVVAQSNPGYAAVERSHTSYGVRDGGGRQCGRGASLIFGAAPKSDGDVDDVDEFDPFREVWTQRQDKYAVYPRPHASASSTRAVSCAGFIVIIAAGTSNGTGTTPRS
jgi:hypothetical protein